MTSVADYMRALYARAATLHCRSCHDPVRRDTPAAIFDALVAAGWYWEERSWIDGRLDRASTAAPPSKAADE